MAYQGDLTEGDPLLTAAEVGAIMRVDPKTVTRWIAAGRFPDPEHGRYPGVVRLPGGRELRIRESVVREWLDGLNENESED
jgi:predicted DNA-binding transcriptional regulator AlpA